MFFEVVIRSQDMPVRIIIAILSIIQLSKQQMQKEHEKLRSILMFYQNMWKKVPVPKDYLEKFTKNTGIFSLRNAFSSELSFEFHKINVAQTEDQTQLSQQRTITKPTNRHQNQSKQRKQILPRGIRNIGNTCYMNSVLQCLHKSQHFTKKFSQMYSNKIQQSQNQSRFKLSHVLQNFITQMSTQNTKPFDNTKPIKQQVQKRNPQFKGYHQNDSIQFLSTLMSILDQEFDDSPQIKKYQKIDHFQDINTVYAQTKQNDQVRIKSICDQTFTGRYKVTYKCLNCNPKQQQQPKPNQPKQEKQETHDYVLFEKFNVHYLDIPVLNQQRKLEGRLKDFQNPDKLQGENKMNCDKCKKQTEHEKIMQIYEANEIFVVCFKRFLDGRKNNLVINIPKKLNIQDIISSQKKQQDKYKNKCYKLNAAISHYGTLSGGHYNAVCFNRQTNKWVKYDDARAEITNDLDLSNAYILFYQLMDEEDDGEQNKKIALCQDQTTNNSETDKGATDKGAQYTMYSIYGKLYLKNLQPEQKLKKQLSFGLEKAKQQIDFFIQNKRQQTHIYDFKDQSKNIGPLISQGSITKIDNLIQLSFQYTSQKQIPQVLGRPQIQIPTIQKKLQDFGNSLYSAYQQIPQIFHNTQKILQRFVNTQKIPQKFAFPLNQSSNNKQTSSESLMFKFYNQFE